MHLSPALPLSHLICALFVSIALPVLAAEPSRQTLFVPLDDGPSWRDMAYLAAIPASEKGNPAGASLVAVDPTAEVGPELADYLRRYQPEAVHVVAPGAPSESIKLPDGLGDKLSSLTADSAEEAALQLSRKFWKTSKTAVLCSEDDYPSALLAAPLASLLEAPLLYLSADGISAATDAEMKRLGAARILTIGANQKNTSFTHLAGAEDVIKWVKQQGMDVRYLAAINPLDRANSKVRKLSLIGAQLAAGRQGLLAPLPFDVEWKKPFKSEPLEKEIPSKFRDQKEPVRSGTLAVNGNSLSYLLIGKPGSDSQSLWLDRDGSGNFTGPLHSGGRIELGGKSWTLSLGIGSSYRDADVHLTWPTAEVLTARLEGYYRMLGRAPEYLCLVGLPDVIPQDLVRGQQLSPDIATDLTFARIEKRQSSEIAVGRVVAEHVNFGSLYAARVLTYSDLLDDTWVNRACQAEWENTLAPLFANVGFDASYHLRDKDIPWIEEPSAGKKGERAPSFRQDSPLASTKLLAHMNHSWNFELGRMMKWDASVLMAPSVVESGGCGTTSLDRSAPGQAVTEGATGARSPELAVKHRSVVSRLFRLGAVSFVGGSREMMAENLPMRQEFWNGVLSGQSVGNAHRRAQNTAFLILKEIGKARKSYAYWHTLHANTLLGDPAVSIRLPGPMRTAPARTEVDGPRITVYAPEKWTSLKMFVPPDWKKWAGRDIHVVRGAGAYSLSSWGPEERDVEIPMVKAEFRSQKKLKTLSLANAPEEPLGWSGVWHTDRNRDGTYTHRFAARMIDFNQETGEILRSVDKLEFSAKFE